MPRIIPFGDKILCKRKIVGEKAGSIFLPDEVKERATDLATVTFVPDLSFADSQILNSADKIIEALIKKAEQGSSDALNTLLRFNEYLKQKSIKVGDEIFISKYVGLDFIETGKNEIITLVRAEDVIGVVMKDE